MKHHVVYSLYETKVNIIKGERNLFNLFGVLTLKGVIHNLCGQSMAREGAEEVVSKYPYYSKNLIVESP